MQNTYVSKGIQAVYFLKYYWFVIDSNGLYPTPGLSSAVSLWCNINSKNYAINLHISQKAGHE